MQIRTPKVASFLRDVALRDLAVHASYAVCVDGRGDVYQWGDGLFTDQRSRSGDGKPVLTLRGKVRLFSFRCEVKFLYIGEHVGHHEGTGHGIPRICAFNFREGVCHTDTTTAAAESHSVEHRHGAVGYELVMGPRR